MVTYSRDAMAEPLRRLTAVIQSVRAGKFDPDASRSGYFRAPDGQECRAADTDDSSSSEGPTDDEAPDHSDEEHACDRVCAPLADDVGPPVRQCVRDKIARYLHTVRDGKLKVLTCGRPLSSFYIPLASVPKVMHPACHVRFRHGR